jgi:hypothetical protein
MTAKVIQGSFLGGQPKLPPPVAVRLPPPIQAKTAARPPGPPTAAFAARRPGPPMPAFAGRPGMVQRHGAGGAFAVEAGPLGLSLGGGRPLPDPVRGKMEAALGANFSDVRVHVGPQAERIGAIAFTVGSDIYFAPGRFQPDTMPGQQLLGHELAHVVQQRAGRVRNPLGSGLAVVQDHALEAEADRLGHRAAAHRVEVQAKMAPLRALPTIQQARRGWKLLDDDEFARRTGLRLDRRGGVPQTPPAGGRAFTPLNLHDPTQWPALPTDPAVVKLGPTELARARAVTQVVKLDPTELAGRKLAPLPSPKKLTPLEQKQLREQTQGSQPAQQPATTKSNKKFKGTPQPLQALTPLQLIANAGNPAPNAGPTRFTGAGINHEYTYNLPGGTTIYIHVHRNLAGLAQTAHAKPERFRFITGTRLTGVADNIDLAHLGTYGINFVDVT